MREQFTVTITGSAYISIHAALAGDIDRCLRLAVEDAIHTHYYLAAAEASAVALQEVRSTLHLV